MQSRDFYSNRLRLTEVADQVGVHLKTVERWTLRGVRGKQLRSTLVGGRRYVLPGDLEDFLDDSTALSPRDPDMPRTGQAADPGTSGRKRRGRR